MSNIGATQQDVDLLARPCKRCGADLFLEHGLRIYCEACNKQDHAARDMRTEAERAEDERLEQETTDLALARLNRNRAFSTFGKHDPMVQLPSVSVKRGFARGYQPMPIDVHVKPVEPKSNADRDVLRDLDWAERQARLRQGIRKPKTNFCTECGEYVNQNHEHTEEQSTV